MELHEWLETTRIDKYTYMDYINGSSMPGVILAYYSRLHVPEEFHNLVFINNRPTVTVTSHDISLDEDYSGRPDYLMRNEYSENDNYLYNQHNANKMPANNIEVLFTAKRDCHVHNINMLGEHHTLAIWHNPDYKVTFDTEPKDLQIDVGYKYSELQNGGWNQTNCLVLLKTTYDTYAHGFNIPWDKTSIVDNTTIKTIDPVVNYRTDNEYFSAPNNQGIHYKKNQLIPAGRLVLLFKPEH